MSNQIITIKLNRFTSYLQQQQQTQSPSPSPTDNFFTIILQWLNFIPDLFTAFLDKLNTIFPPETREQWLNAAAAHWLLLLAASALLLCFLCCCLPPILSCITRVIVAIFNLIKGFFMMILNAITSVFRCLCCCGRRSEKMMKAPGRGGRVFIPRAGFESNPAGYFQGLRGVRASSSRLY